MKKKNNLETKKPPLKKNKKSAEILKAGYTPRKLYSLNNQKTDSNVLRSITLWSLHVF